MLKTGTIHFDKRLGTLPGFPGARSPNGVLTQRSKPNGCQRRSQGTHHRHPAYIKDRRIDSDRTHTHIPQLLLKGSTIRTSFQQASSEGMPKAMAGCRFACPGLAYRPAARSPNRRRIPLAAVRGARTQVPVDADEGSPYCQPDSNWHWDICASRHAPNPPDPVNVRFFSREGRALRLDAAHRSSE